MDAQQDAWESARAVAVGHSREQADRQETVRSPQHDRLDGGVGRRVAAYSAFVWMVVFDAFHVYWGLGGRFGFGDQSDPLPRGDSVGQRAFGLVVLVLFVLGTALPLAIVQAWGRWIPGWVLVTMAWVAAGLLTVRALAAFIDDAMRTLLGSATGISGLTYEQLLGTADPSAYTLWSARAIDVYFFIGGVLYGVTAWYSRRRRHDRKSPAEQAYALSAPHRRRSHTDPWW